MATDVGHEDDEHRVTFNPPLFLQRRAWVLDVIRREKVTSVLDIGCGEGSLLSCLANPAACLPPTSPSKTYPDDHYEIHAQVMAGLDIAENELRRAIQGLSPIEEQQTNHWCNPPARWETQHTKVWHGGFETFNPEWVYNPSDGPCYECIVSTEVIEHLPPDIFPLFAPMLLGKYQPKLLLLTTPNYTYNSRFRPTNGTQSDGGYPDPTGRTNRVFRHDDHKFEWTTEEFTSWCETEAEQYGYTVEVSGVGRCMEGGDENLGFASLCAVFQRSPRSPSVPQSQSEEGSCTHELLFEVQHVGHPASGQPLSHEEIITILKSIYQKWNVPALSVQELWTDVSLTIACGGRTEFILNAVSQSGDANDRWKITDEGRKWGVSVEWGGFESMECADLWEEPEMDPVEDTCDFDEDDEYWPERKDIDHEPTEVGESHLEAGWNSHCVTESNGWGQVEGKGSAWASWTESSQDTAEEANNLIKN